MASFIQHVVLVALASATAAPPPGAVPVRGGGVEEAPRPPNIIFLQVDSMDGRLLDPSSPYWDKVALPNFHALAQAGVNFASTYTASPQCVPSRTAMVTSRYVHETNTWDNGMGIAASVFRAGDLDTSCVAAWNASTCEGMAALQGAANVTVFNALLGAGYDLHVYNRLDIGAGLLDAFPNGTGDGFHGGPSLPILARSADIRRPTDVDPVKWVDDNTPTPYASDVSYEERVVEWLGSHDPSSPTPWMLWFGILDPHPPYSTNSTYLASVNESNVDAPPQPDRASMHPADSYMSISKNVWGEYTEEQVKAVRRSYWGAVAEADAIMGRVLDAARASGHLANTVVVFTSDHGEMGMEHRQDLKNSLYEPSVRVPLIMAGYGDASSLLPSGLVIPNVTSHLDVMPTLLELAGVGGGLPAARGFSLSPFFTPSPPTPFPRPCAAFEFHSNLGNTGSFGIRKDEWKLVVYGTAGGYPWFAANYTPQLFDVVADPFELRDVAGANPAVVSALHDALVAEWRGATPQDIDAQAKAVNVQLYRAWYGGLGVNERKVAFASVFDGFDESDWERVLAWEGTPGVVV